MGLSAALEVLSRGRARLYFLSACTGLLPLLLTSPAIANSGVVVVQESNGFPGGEEATRLSRQQLSFQGGRLRVFDPTHLWALYVSLGDKTVQEASIASRQYVERAFSYYDKYRQDRKRSLKAQTTEYLRLRDRIDDEEQLRELRNDYRKVGGNPENPGQIVARLFPYPNDTKTVTILVDREPREVTVEHVVIRENDKDIAAFDLWITKDLELPVDLLDFYRELVPFGPEVHEQLSKIEGTLLECRASLDTGTFHRTFRSKVIEIRLNQPLSEGDLTIPASWERVAQQEKRGPKAGMVTCALDGKQVPSDEARSYRDPRDGRRYHACDSSERRTLIRMLSKGERPPHRAEGGGS